MGNVALDLVRAFPKLSEQQRSLLLSKGETLAYKSGEVIIREGEKIDSILLVREGVVRVTREYLDLLCAEFTGPLGPGDILGEISFVDGEKASATLVADGDVEILKFTRPDVEKMIRDVSGFAGGFYQSLMLTACQRLRATNIRVLPPGP